MAPLKNGDLVMINSMGLQRHRIAEGELAIVHEQKDDIVLSTMNVPDIWEVYCFRLGKKMIFFEDELILLSSKQTLKDDAE